MGMIGEIAALGQTALGIGQTIGGLFMKNPKLPEYEISSETKSNLSDAYMNRNEGIGSATRRNMLQEGIRAGSSALASSSSRKGGLGLVASIAQQRTDQAGQIAQMDEQRRTQNLDRLYRAREVMSAEKSKQFAVKQGNIQDQRNKRAQMIGAGTQNLMNAIGTAAGMDALDGGYGDGDGTGKSLLRRRTKSPTSQVIGEL